MKTQNKVVDALLKLDSYPEETSKIDLIQTHISFVFITDNFVYKVKKAVNFGFLDFSTLENRYFYCQKELEINRRLCPQIYLEVVSVNQKSKIKIKGEGKIIEYALKMKRLPQERIMTLLLKEGKVYKETIDGIAKIVSQFHEKAQTSPQISQFGNIKIVKTNWDENFSQTTKYIDRTIPKATFQFIQNQIKTFIEENIALFEDRIANNRIRDCHGDLHSGNKFITDQICIFDAIEFNDRFRYSDVAADVAFLAMDLDFQQRPDLSRYFLKCYLEYSKDKQLMRLLAFYKCYRAYVRGKVTSFKLDDTNIKQTEKTSAVNEAQAYFKLASEYAKSL
jgi:aminoglycoside phosphotransferase family enzyme